MPFNLFKRSRDRDPALPTHESHHIGSGRDSSSNSDPANMKQRRPRRGLFAPKPDCPYGRRPGFKLWWTLFWEDVAYLVILAIVGLAIMMRSPRVDRYFAVSFRDGELVYPEFSYPKRATTVPLAADAVVAVLGPIAVILLMNFRIRCFWDINNGVFGVFYSVLTAAIFQLFMKITIGGLRPNFLTVCEPAFPADQIPQGQGYSHLYFLASEVCTNPDPVAVSNGMQSFPSGHSTAAWAGMLYLSLYLNAKLKFLGTAHAAGWKMGAICLPLLAAVLICGSVSVDANHNGYDIIAGSIIGIICALLAFRTVYGSIWDFRFNHIPLPPRRGGDISWRFQHGFEEASAWSGFTFSRSGGWKRQEEEGLGGGFGGQGGDTSGYPISVERKPAPDPAEQVAAPRRAEV